jgi:hypothetical protein
MSMSFHYERYQLVKFGLSVRESVAMRKTTVDHDGDSPRSLWKQKLLKHQKQKMSISGSFFPRHTLGMHTSFNQMCKP